VTSRSSLCAGAVAARIPPVLLEVLLRRCMKRALLALRAPGTGSQHCCPIGPCFPLRYSAGALLSLPIEAPSPRLSDLLLFELEEAPGVPTGDVVEFPATWRVETARGTAAGGLPALLPLAAGDPRRLLARGRGPMRLPGSFRRSQNLIGGTRPGNATRAPPPAGGGLMGQLEQLHPWHAWRGPCPACAGAGRSGPLSFEHPSPSSTAMADWAGC